MLNLVNGYVCMNNPEDTDLAKRGVDPAHVPRLRPGTPPAKEPEEAETAAQEEQPEPRKSIEPGVGIKLDVTG